MAKKSTEAQTELEEFRNRLEWLDEERRRSSRRLVELEQRVTSQERDLESREKLIQDLEERLTKATSQLARLAQVDTQLQIFKDEITGLIEQSDKRHANSLSELDKLRRVEQEVQRREMSDMRKEMVTASNLQSELELRQAEEARLAKLLGIAQGKISALEKNIEPWHQELHFVEESERTNARSIGELHTTMLELGKRFESMESRLDVAGHNLSKYQATAQDLTDAISDLRNTVKSWEEQVQIGEFERNRRLDSWQRTLDEQQVTMERYGSEWVSYSEKYKEAKTTLETLDEWRKQVDLQQNEAAELARLEANRMRSRWDNFLTEYDKQWKNLEVDQEQRWSAQSRREKQALTQLVELSEAIAQLQQDRDILWRVQTAQNDAIGKLPRVWLEEVEKALAHNPNSRRQPALVPVREE